MKQTLALALRPSVVKRALKYAVVVGAILITINHGDAILRGDLPPARLFRMGLTVLVPMWFRPYPASGRCAKSGISRRARMS